jgi:hypothetical protein
MSRFPLLACSLHPRRRDRQSALAATALACALLVIPHFVRASEPAFDPFATARGSSKVDTGVTFTRITTGDHPSMDPVSGDVLDNTLMVNGVEAPHGTKITPP